jgi:hypothetical protein
MKDYNTMLKIDRTDLYKVLDNMLVCKNKNEFLKLLVPLIGESPNGLKWFFKLHNYDTLPKILDNNTLCYINVDDMGWIPNKDKLLKKGNSIICNIIGFSGFHTYNAYTISYTGINDLDQDVLLTTTVDEKVIIPIEEF